MPRRAGSYGRPPKKMPPHGGDPSLPYKYDSSNAGNFAARPQLLPYNPVAAGGAVVVASDNMARFTILTPRLIRMEYAKLSAHFEDRATIAMLNRNLPVPSFTHSESGGVLTITTSQVSLTYVVGTGSFSASSLKVATLNGTSGFPGWTYGQAAPGNLLGTIRGLDGQGPTPLNCTLNAGIDDNGEFNHCQLFHIWKRAVSSTFVFVGGSFQLVFILHPLRTGEWGLVSRDGWVIYNDTLNACTDANDWWSADGLPPAPRNCTAPAANTDAVNPARSSMFPDGIQAATQVRDDCDCGMQGTYPQVLDGSGSYSQNCVLLLLSLAVFGNHAMTIPYVL